MAVSVNPVVRVFSAGVPVSNAKIYVYQTGTTTPVTTYSDGTLSTPNTNPVITDVNGEATIYVSASTNLRYYITTSAAVLIKDIDPVYPSLILTGLTASVSQLNLLDSSSSVAVYASSTNIVLKSSNGIKLNNDQPILDSSGNTYIAFSKTASAVNGITVTNAATLTAPLISATGTDSNIDLDVSAKGTGIFSIRKPGTAFKSQLDNSALTASRVITIPDYAVNLRGSKMIQSVGSINGSVQFGSTVIPFDDTIPQVTEGDQYFSQAITPQSSTSVLIVNVNVWLSHQNVRHCTVALFRDGASNAVAASAVYIDTTNGHAVVSFKYTVTSGSTSATTFTVRAGSDSTGSLTVNGVNNARRYGGVAVSGIEIYEVI